MKDMIKHKVRAFLSENKTTRIVAGVLIKCTSTNRVLLLERNDGNSIELWSIVTGGVEDGENILDGLKREVNEELGIDPNIIKYDFIRKTNMPNKNMVFNYFQGFTKSEFNPILNHENHNYGWFDVDDLPTPLYPNTKEKINEI